MGKLILGIVAVIVLQISFSIYLAKESADHKFASLELGPIVKNNSGQTRDAGLASAANSQNHEPLSIEPSAGVAPLEHDSFPAGRVRTKALPKTVETRQVSQAAHRSYSNVAGRPRRMENGITNSVRRDYFGGMVVETSFRAAGARVAKLRTGKARRIVFGRMTVERKFDI